VFSVTFTVGVALPFPLAGVRVHQFALLLALQFALEKSSTVFLSAMPDSKERV